MSHNIATTADGRNAIAFLGDRKDIWHKLGQQMQPGMSIEEWAVASGLDWSALMVPAYADLRGTQLETTLANKMEVRDRGLLLVDGQKHIIRGDTGFCLGYATDSYKPVQPIETLNFFDDYISVDPRFRLDVAGNLRGGRQIWATAVFDDGSDYTVGGDAHRARLLMTTSFDQTAATVNMGTVVRVVCNNTLSAALAGKGGIVKTRHNTKFNAEAVGKELAEIIKGFANFKAMGDAMAETHFSKEQVSKFFKTMLDIPFDLPASEVGTRKMNQFEMLNGAYKATVVEGTEPETVWTALNAATRYVDHDRGTRDTGYGETEARLYATQFGTGAKMKAEAVQVLYDMTDGDLLRAVIAKTEADKDIKAMLRQPLRTR
jgi:phage/plasmid-like protein (TIGR03299 family)